MFMVYKLYVYKSYADWTQLYASSKPDDRHQLNKDEECVKTLDTEGWVTSFNLLPTSYWTGKLFDNQFSFTNMTWHIWGTCLQNL